MDLGRQGEALSIEKYRDAVARLDDDERDTQKVRTLVGVRHDVEGNNITTFIVTIELAKHLAMMARTEKGKQIRDYFLECEKKAQPQFQIPQTYSEALMLAAKQAEQIEQQTALIEAQKPKVEFYEAVTGSSDTIDIASVAKVLKSEAGL